MDEKYIGRKISYRNDALGKGTIKDVVVLGVNVGYRDLTSVINHPINGSPKYMFVFSNTQRQKDREDIKKSGDWYVGNEISFFERRRLNKILKTA